MKNKFKTNIFFLIALVILFTLSSPINNYNLIFNVGNGDNSSEYYDNANLDNESLKLSKISGKIHIINNSGWVDFRNDGNCTGSGTYSDPYVIEDLVIDGGGSGNCIWIENSNVYFKIENCILYNSGAGIRFSNVNSSRLINNNCSSNLWGIALVYSNNNEISGNTANNNHWSGIKISGDYNKVSGNTVNNNENGIYLIFNDHNTISGNTANNNIYGIFLFDNSNYTLSGNIMNECGLRICGSLEMLTSGIIDITNLVNGKPLYYYTNEINLRPANFTNAGQVILVNCHDSLISNLDVSYGSIGISLHYCKNNEISGNTANYNYGDGILLSSSNYNSISRNTANENDWYGIRLCSSDYNTISGNSANYNYGDGIRLSSSDYNSISGNTANNNENGIYLSFNDHNTVSGNTANYNYGYGIYLWDGDNNMISGNTVNNNNHGIHLSYSDYNTISGNILLGNEKCIVEENCEGNVFKNNYCIEEELIILISVISGGTLIGLATLLLIRRKRRRTRQLFLKIYYFFD